MKQNPLKDVKQAIRQPYAWPGGYPLHIVMSDGGCLCCDCAKREFLLIARSTIQGQRDGWNAAGIMVNWEDIDLLCDHCGRTIESAYGE
jgi:hypothetical protein